MLLFDINYCYLSDFLSYLEQKPMMSDWFVQYDILIILAVLITFNFKLIYNSIFSKIILKVCKKCLDLNIFNVLFTQVSIVGGESGGAYVCDAT